MKGLLKHSTFHQNRGSSLTFIDFERQWPMSSFVETHRNDVGSAVIFIRRRVEACRDLPILADVVQDLSQLLYLKLFRNTGLCAVVCNYRPYRSLRSKNDNIGFWLTRN